MREELELKLMEKYPFMEAKCVFTGQKSKFPVGCEFDDGWFELIDSMCQEIQEFYRKNREDMDDIIVLQAKEKYGKLNFYIGNYIKGVFDIVNKYQEKSRTVCELCGENGALRVKNSWFKTLCDKHREELVYVELQSTIVMYQHYINNTKKQKKDKKWRGF